MSVDPYWTKQAKKRMRELGYTQNDLLDVFEVNTRGAVGHYFTGRAIINVDQLEKLSMFLGVHIDYCEPKKAKTNISIEEFASILDKWLVKLKQLNFVTYSIDLKKIRDLILSDVIDSLPEEKRGEYNELLKAK